MEETGMRLKNKNYNAKNHVRRKKISRPFILVFCAIVSLLLIAGVTFSWFVGFDNITNFFSNNPKKFFEVKVVDIFKPPADPDPYTPIPKIVGAWNTGETPGLVRIMVIPTIVAADGTALPASMGNEVLMDDFNGTDWIDGGDGYYYYKHILQSGENTNAMSPKKNLFTTLYIAEGLDPVYTGAHLNIEVKIEAVGIDPPGEYIAGWWNGTVPINPVDPLYDVWFTLNPLV